MGRSAGVHYKVIHARISQSLAVKRKDEIFDTITTSKKPTKQQLLYMGVTGNNYYNKGGNYYYGCGNYYPDPFSIYLPRYFPK